MVTARLRPAWAVGVGGTFVAHGPVRPPQPLPLYRNDAYVCPDDSRGHGTPRYTLSRLNSIYTATFRHRGCMHQLTLKLGARVITRASGSRERVPVPRSCLARAPSTSGTFARALPLARAARATRRMM